MKKLHLINSDIKYLKSILFGKRRSCSFGAGKASTLTTALKGLSVSSKPTVPKARVLAVDTRTIVEICGLKIYIYFYPSDVGNKNAGVQTLMKTPWGKNEMYSNEYEGKNHPYCKIEIPNGYENFTFNDRGIFDGKSFIYTMGTTLPTIVDDNMLLALLINLSYSLYERLNNYIILLEKGNVIDQGHLNAGAFTKNVMDNLFKLIKNNSKKSCIKDWLNSIKFNPTIILYLFKKMNEFRLNKETKLQNYIITFYNNLFNDEPLPDLPIFDKRPVLAPRNLNLELK